MQHLNNVVQRPAALSECDVERTARLPGSLATALYSTRSIRSTVGRLLTPIVDRILNRPSLVACIISLQLHPPPHSPYCMVGRSERPIFLTVYTSRGTRCPNRFQSVGRSVCLLGLMVGRASELDAVHDCLLCAWTSSFRGGGVGGGRTTTYIKARSQISVGRSASRPVAQTASRGSAAFTVRLHC